MNTLLNSIEALDVVKNHYALDNINYCMFIRRGFNDSYYIATAHKNYIFRLYLNDKYYIDSIDAYRFELDLLAHLHANAVPVACALPNMHGELLGTIPTISGDRAFALFHCADGIPLSARSLTENQSFQIGKRMADVHLAADSFKTTYKRYTLDLKYIIDEPQRLIAEGAETSSSNSQFDDLISQGKKTVEMLQPMDQSIKKIQKIGNENGEFGIIHADMHNGNFHFHGEDLTLFDFDHCAYGWRVYDLAIAQHFPEVQRKSIIEGYESRRSLSSEERDCLKDFGNLRNLWDIGDTLATQSMSEYPEN